MRDSFIIYKSFYESTKELGPEIRCEIYDAIMEYGFNKKEIELSGVAKAIFTLIKPQLDANNKKYENGCKGGRPKTEKKPKNNLKETNLKPNDNENENDNDNDKKKNNKKKNFKVPTLEEVEEYCKERSNGINAQSFIDFYDSKGWMIGKNKMKDWKAAIRTWERKRSNSNFSETNTPKWFEEDLGRGGFDDDGEDF